MASKKSAEVRLFLSEDIRRETGGKVTLVGFYTDNILIAQAPPEPGQAVALRSLGVMFNISRIAPGPTVKVRVDALVQGEPAPFMAEADFPHPGAGRSVNLTGVISPFVFQSFGKRSFRVFVNDEAHEVDFEIRAASDLDLARLDAGASVAPEVVPPRPQPPAPGRKKEPASKKSPAKSRKRA